MKLIGADGNYRYSEVREVQLKLTNATIRILPNPISTNAMMEIRTDKTESGSMQLVDAGGKIVVNKSITLQPGLNRVDVSNWKTMGAGVYIVYVVTASMNLNTKVVIQ